MQNPTQKTAICLLIALIYFSLGIQSSIAQTPPDNEVKPLGEILNDPIDLGNDGKPLTSSLLANHYYKTCINEKTLAFDKEEKKILCGCNAAKMSQTLSVQDFKDLDKKTKKGNDARSRMLAHSYAPCMQYVIKKKVETDCARNKFLRDIVIGKKHICQCVSEDTQNYVINNAAYLIRDSQVHNPLSLDPLEHYFTKPNYESQMESTIRRCRYKVEYERVNN